MSDIALKNLNHGTVVDRHEIDDDGLIDPVVCIYVLVSVLLISLVPRNSLPPSWVL